MQIKHKFFGKECFIDRALADRSKLELALKELAFAADKIMFVNQIHSAEICVIDDAKKIHGTQNLPKADAIVTNLKNLAIAVITADCAPILLQDLQAKVIAATHAGWRGARFGVIEATISAMKNLGAKTNQITANLGPMIHQKSYQVDQNFCDEFLKEDAKNQKFFIKDAEQKYLFDLPSYIKSKLERQGISKIQDVAIDTYEHHQKYSSYRKATHQGVENSGRNISLIVMND